MIREVVARLNQGYRTIDFPGSEPKLPERFRGRPVVHPERCISACRACADSCPVDAIDVGQAASGLGVGLTATTKLAQLDLGRCLFCGACAEACGQAAIEFTQDYRLSVRKRADLLIGKEHELILAAALDKEMLRVFGRSLKLRQVSAGGCNACEVDVNVLNTVVFDLGRFGVQFVASPRHADGILITGPVTQNMKLALQKTYEAVPDPKFVIAVGACAISGGLFASHRETCGGAQDLVPIDLFIPGCPPHPLTTLDGLLRLLGKR